MLSTANSLKKKIQIYFWYIWCHIHIISYISHIYTHIYTSMCLIGDLASPAQLRLCLWFVTPPPPVRRASASGSSRLSLQFVTLRLCSASSLTAACLRYLILRLWCASTTSACLYTRSVSRDACRL